MPEKVLDSGNLDKGYSTCIYVDIQIEAKIYIYQDGNKGIYWKIIIEAKIYSLISGQRQNYIIFRYKDKDFYQNRKKEENYLRRKRDLFLISVLITVSIQIKINTRKIISC